MKKCLFTHVPIEKINSSNNFQEIYSKYISKNKPVIIKGDMDSWPGFGKWTLDFFKSTYGHDDVKVTNFPRNDATDNKFTTTDLKLREYIDSLDSCNWKDQKRPPYLTDWHCLDQHVELLSDFQLPPYVKNWAESWKFMKKFSCLGLLIGPKNAVYNLHIDAFGTHAFIAQFIGKKKVLLFPPNQTKNLYNGLVDPSSPDYNKYPLFNNIQGAQEGILEPGEILFIPSMWWHQVTSLSHAISMVVNVFNRTMLLNFMRSMCNLQSLKNFAQFIKNPFSSGGNSSQTV